MKNLKLKVKTALLGAALISFIAATLFVLYAQDAKAKVRDQYVEKARSIVMTVESVREDMGKKWENNIFKQEDLAEWGRTGQKEKVLTVIPVVAAWRSAMNKAEQGNYEFRVPKHHPRNPKNEPDPLESRVLKMFAAGSADEHYEIDESMNAIRFFKPIRLTAECMMCHGDPATSVDLWGNDQGLDVTGAKMENWKVGEVHGAFEVIQCLDDADAQIASALWKAGLFVAGIVVLASLLLYWVASRSLVTPIASIVDVSRKIADGDLTQRVDLNRKDELGELSDAINTSTKNLQGIIGEVVTTADTLTSSATELSTTATQLAAGAEQTTSESATVAAAAEEMSVNMKNMAGASQEMSTNVGSVSESVKEMTSAITEVAQSSEQAASVAQEAAQLVNLSNTKVSQLHEATEAIGKVTEVIQDIAEQTNLLALNATIEAARAGEAGKGFAVVATEVKELAKQTAEATEDIRKRIEGIQISTNDAVTAITEIGAVVDRVNDASKTIASAVEEQSITTQQISGAVDRTAVAAETTSTSVTESATATREITESIVKVDHRAKETAEAANRAQHSSTDLSGLASELSDAVKKFKV